MKMLVKILLAAACCFSAIGCSSLTQYSTGTAGTNPDGTSKGQRAIKRTQFYGDTYGATTIKPDGTIEVKDFNSSNVLYAYSAVTDGKGNPLKDGNGNVVYNTTPIVPGIRNSEATMSVFRGVSLVIRSVSNLAGTILTGWFGVTAAQQAGSAANSGISYVAQPTKL